MYKKKYFEGYGTLKYFKKQNSIKHKNIQKQILC